MNNHVKTSFFWVALLVLASLLSAADVPQLINYQGRLTDSGGNALDTIVSITFTIYDDSTGGNSKWTETDDSVIVLNGLFNVLLGSTGLNGVHDSVFSDPDRFLGIQIGSDPELSPRSRLVSVGYAMHAKQADTALFAITGPASGGGWTDGGTEVRLSTATDNVIIGETTPLTAGTKLEVRGYAGADTALSRIYFNNSNPLQMHYPAFELYNAAYNYIPLKINGAGIILQSINNKGGRAEELVNQIGPDTTYFNGGPVGIGMTSPTNKLHVSGASFPPDPVVLIEQTGTGRGLRVNSSGGACGIVSEAGNHGLRVIDAGSGSNTNADGIHVMHAWHDGIHVVDADNDGIHVENAGGWAGYFGGSGYFRDSVGIGTETPSEKLEVDGTIYSRSGGFRFPDGSVQVTASDGSVSADGSGLVNHFPKFTSVNSIGNSSLSESGDGNIGIGYETPHSNLHIEGSIAKSVNIVASDYTITDNDCIIIGNGISNFNVYLPSASGIAGRIYTIKNTQGSNIDIVPIGGEILEGSAAPWGLSGWDFITIVSDGANWLIVGKS